MPAVADPSMLDVSLPVFAIILMGYLCGRFRLLGEGAATAVNGFTYYAAMPALFLGAITSAGFSLTDHLGYISVLVGAQLAVFGGKYAPHSAAADLLHDRVFVGDAVASTGLLGRCRVVVGRHHGGRQRVGGGRDAHG